MSAAPSGPAAKAAAQEVTAATQAEPKKQAAQLEEDDEFEDFPVEGQPHR